MCLKVSAEIDINKFSISCKKWVLLEELSQERTTLRQETSNKLLTPFVFYEIYFDTER